MASVAVPGVLCHRSPCLLASVLAQMQRHTSSMARCLLAPPCLPQLLVLGLLAMPAFAAPATPPQIPRDLWKDCLYNGQVIRCQDTQSAEVLRIVWIDGIRSAFYKQPSSATGKPSLWRDRYGGLWRRELFIQGNTGLTNLRTGHQIVIPLRLTCKPPLKGEVGYCRDDNPSP